MTMTPQGGKRQAVGGDDDDVAASAIAFNTASQRQLVEAISHQTA